MQDLVFTFTEARSAPLLPESFLKEWTALAKKVQPAKRGTDLVLQVLTAKQQRLSRRKIKKLFERGLVKNYVFKNIAPDSIGEISPADGSDGKHTVDLTFSYEVKVPS